MLLILYSIISHFERKGDVKTDSPLMDWMFLHRWLLHNFKAHSVFPLISIIKVHTSGENQIPHRTRNTLKAVHSFFQSILKEKKGSQRAATQAMLCTLMCDLFVQPLAKLLGSLVTMCLR